MRELRHINRFSAILSHSLKFAIAELLQIFKKDENHKIFGGLVKINDQNGPIALHFFTEAISRDFKPTVQKRIFRLFSSFIWTD